MTDSEVALLQRELHAIAERNAADHRAVSEAIENVRTDVARVYERIAELEKQDYGQAVGDNTANNMRSSARAWLVATATAASAVTVIAIELIGRNTP